MNNLKNTRSVALNWALIACIVSVLVCLFTNNNLTNNTYRIPKILGEFWIIPPLSIWYLVPLSTILGFGLAQSVLRYKEIDKHAFEIDLVLGLLLSIFFSLIYYFQLNYLKIFNFDFGIIFYVALISFSFFKERTLPFSSVYSSSIIGAMYAFPRQNNFGVIENVLVFTYLVLVFILIGIIISNFVDFIVSILEALFCLVTSKGDKALQSENPHTRICCDADSKEIDRIIASGSIDE